MLKDQLVNVFIEEYLKFLVDYQLLVVVMSVSFPPSLYTAWCMTE